MDDLWSALSDRLEELEIGATVHSRGQGQPVDFDVELSRGGSRQRFEIELRTRPTLSSLGTVFAADAASHPVLLGAQSISPRSADGFRRAGIQYLDAAGNAWIQFGDVLIDVRGRTPRRDSTDDDQARSAGNLFSTARAQVALVLLQWPSSWKKPQREVAAAAGVSLGQTHDALRMLSDAGFGPYGHRRPSELLDLWAASFKSGLAQKLLLATYRGSVDTFRKVDAEDPVFAGGPVVSGEFAAAELRGTDAMTIYVNRLDPMLPVKNRWRSDGPPNITVRRKFWTTPADEPHDYDGPLAGLPRAPLVLMYADLLASDDPRVRGIAPEWRSRIAGLE